MMVRFAAQNTEIPNKFFSPSFDWEGASKIVDRLSVEDPKWVDEFVELLLVCAHEDDIPFLEVGPSSHLYHEAPDDAASFDNGEFRFPWPTSAHAELDAEPNEQSSTTGDNHGASPSLAHRERDHGLLDEEAEPQDFSQWTEPSWAMEPAFSEPLSPTVTGWSDITGESGSSTAAESPRSSSSSSTISLGDEWLSQEQEEEKFFRSLATMGPEDDLPSQPQPMRGCDEEFGCGMGR
jgi:hypothetical protein